ncbi:MAG: NAD-dependent succinate-semialdehyde dehydrogenase [Nocardioides sp.]|uniref:NAD-dependent succinate-semialdehyde dehydrogenase n=1 Tax=Nocardioides sp. TaxID=35761 RepID=UPI0039E3645A
MPASAAVEAPVYPPIQLYIDGAWTDGSGSRREPVYDPATGEVVGEVPVAEAADLDAALAAADRGWRAWRDTGVEARSAILARAADLLRERAGQIGPVMTLESGKPLREATGEVQRAAFQLDWNIEEGRRAYGRIIPTGPDEMLSVVHQGVGPVAAFTAWNFPIGGPMRKIAAALAAGCSIVIKASEEVPATAVALVRAFHDAGLPAGVLNLVFGVPAEISTHLIASPITRFVAFTGSIPVGKHLAGLAAQRMLPTIMELGGHAPVIVCPDVDPAAAARSCVRGKFVNAGQVCTSPSRFFVHEDIHDAFTDAFVTAAEQLVVGNGLDAGVQMGPLSSQRRRQAVAGLVADATNLGARVATGGTALAGPGWFYAPTVLTDVPAQARVLREEPFGPIAPILRYADLDEALAQANSLPYGLAAYCFTHRADLAARLTRELEAGILSVNHVGGSVPQAPSGGFKESGHGREGGYEGLADYLETKRISHKLAI